MDVLIFCAVVVALTAFVAAPLYGRARMPKPPISEHQARREALDAALRDLEVDHASGLVDEETYVAERDRLTTESASLMRADAPTD